MWKDTLVRTISAVCGLAIFFNILFMSPIVLQCAVGVLSLLMIYEVVRALGFKLFGTVLACLGGLCMLLALTFGSYTDFFATFAITTAVISIYALAHNETMTFSDVSICMFMMVYIIYFMHCIPLVRGLSTKGLLLLFLIFICAWISDTGAYFAGKFFGKHKLIEKVSPKKTVEGAIGGVVTTALAAMLLGFIAQSCCSLEANYWVLALAGMIGSVLGQVGDLIASWLKRQYGIKDFGKLMPGHGGAMDRFDSVVLTAPFVYFLVHYLPKIGLYLIR